MAELSELFDEQAAPAREVPPPLRWRSWPAGESLWRTFAGVAALTAAAGVVQWVAQRPALTCLAVAVLVIASWRFFLPVEFQLNEEGVEQRVLGRRCRIAWQAIEDHQVCASGVWLLPWPDRRPWATFRGLYLPWTTHREQVLAHIRYHLQSSGE